MTPTDLTLKPLLFTPLYKEKLWGGRNLKTTLHKEIPPDSPIGESWELSGYGADTSQCITNGFDTRSLQQLLEQFTTDLTGTIPPTPFFPLLFKFIDAHDRLSVQVHPGDEQARANGWGDFGKTECWYIAGAKPQGEIIVGFKDGVTLDDVRCGIRDNTLEQILNRIPIAPGDVLFIPAGTVHAILGGTLLYEVQETSDTTFRLYDWGRVDRNGNARDLHIEESLQVLDTSYHVQHKIPSVPADTVEGARHFFRAACRYFALEEYLFTADADIALPPKKSFAVISVLNGSPTVVTNGDKSRIAPGDTILIPAVCAKKSFRIEAAAETRFLLTTVPDLKTEVVDYLRNLGIPTDDIQSLGGSETHNDIIPFLE